MATLSEADAFFDQLVEVGRDAVGVTQGCNGVMALLIGQDEESLGREGMVLCVSQGKCYGRNRWSAWPPCRGRPIESLGRYQPSYPISTSVGYRFHWSVPVAYGPAVAVGKRATCFAPSRVQAMFSSSMFIWKDRPEKPCCSKPVQKAAGVSKTVEQVSFIAVEWLVDKKSSRIL